MIRIDEQLTGNLSAEARQAPRLRKNHNFHEFLDDSLQRMLNALEPGTYVQPHKHEDPDKREVFLAISGKMVVIEFNDQGQIQSHHIIGPNESCRGVEIPAGTWHTIISLEPGSVAFEVKDGPYEPLNDKNFANWAPKEGSSDCKIYLEDILGQLKITVS